MATEYLRSGSKLAAVCAVVGTMLAGAAVAEAQTIKYPAKRVDMVVGFAAGGFADTVARFVALRLSERIGQPVVVENRGGAGGNLAARAVRGAEPDGYTILATTTAIAINQSMYSKLGFSIDDFVPVSISAASPETMATHPNKRTANLAEFVKWAKARGEINFATAGVGSGSHLATEYFFRTQAKVKAVHVPFRGGALAVQAILGDQVDLITSSFGVNSNVISGKLIGLGVAGPARNPSMPDVPTFKEMGFPYEAESWVGFFVPAKTNPVIAAHLNAEINAILSEPFGRGYLTKLGLNLTPRTVPEAQAYLKSEVEKWGTMVRSIGVRAD